MQLCHIFFATLVALAVAQDGGSDGPTTSPEATGYSCDPSTCRLPTCQCASTSPPGGLDPAQVPQFIVFSADDAIQSYTLDAVNQFLAQRRNPNECSPKMTYFTSLDYTNYTMVTDWYAAGNEIADHTMTHVGTPAAEEINGNLIALNALAGIPLSSIKGFRAPFLDFNADTLRTLHKSEFLYDSSAVASVPVTDPSTDAYWPYTLDNGLANNCLTEGLCQGEPRLPGLWEIPMYAFFDERGVGGRHLMDPWLEAANGNNRPDDQATLRYMQATFTDHYTNNRQPIGLYTHPIHVSMSYPGVTARPRTVEMINRFLDWAQDHDNVWIVSNEQLLDWVRNPVPASQVGSIPSFQCRPTRPDPAVPICNGVPSNQGGLLARCPFSEFPFFTCYGCPSTKPTPQNPNPAQPDDQEIRYRLPDDCAAAFWDPIGGVCTCTSDSCAFSDVERSIGPDGAKFSGGGVGGGPIFGGSPSGNDDNRPGDGPYLPFNGAPATAGLPSIFLYAAHILSGALLAGVVSILR
ncbi:hypothetical protein FA15DRAFT_669712 [Coprinopsis marcescibilis]|uniref:Chitin deacetylase n=1 Tax=Coprinopsis marcescibilis TaxID=230819 RepID=A0A5C3KUG0_COPMA|nr:hypothetical protein FA15DRAFT_669712 [Coprinopsis marcescibilis]